MPVDHPAPISAQTRLIEVRLLKLALGFLVMLGLLMLLHRAFGLGGLIS